MEYLQPEVRKLVDHICSLGGDFKIVRAKPEVHIGAVITDAVLQVGHRWKTHVEPRVERIKTDYPNAATICELLHLLETVGECGLLNWNGIDEQERFRLTIHFFAHEGINTVDDLTKWLESEDNRDRLISKSTRVDKAGIPKIADKTADYYRVMVGLPDAVAVDRFIKEFFDEAGIEIRRYRYKDLRAIVQLAARPLSIAKGTEIKPLDLDQSIWKYKQSQKGIKRAMCDEEQALRTSISLPSEGEFNMETNSLSCEGKRPEIIVLSDETVAGPILAEVQLQCGRHKLVEDPTPVWEIAVTRQDEYEKLPTGAFPVTTGNRAGKGVLLMCGHHKGQHKCEASFHRKKDKSFWIGSARIRLNKDSWTDDWRDFLHQHGLDKLDAHEELKKVILKFEALVLGTSARP